MSTNKILNSFAGGHTVSTKEVVKNVNGKDIKVGIVEGYIATWDLDRGNGWWKDRFVKGAFSESITRHKQNNNRQVRLKDHHGMTVGGFPIETVREDEVGLFGIGEINLEVKQGREMYALINQKVLVDFSIGFGVVDATWEETDGEEMRIITKAEVWEGSVVDEPMNQFANITGVKSVEDLSSIDNVRDMEKILVESGFSNRAAKAFISGVKNLNSGCRDDNQNLNESGGDESDRDDQDKLSQEIKKAHRQMMLSSIKNNI